jgi:hypothetical protein
MPRQARSARHARQARCARYARDRAAALAGATQWLTGPVRRRKTTLVLAGTALALAGAGSAAAATPAGAPPTAPAQRAQLTADLRPAAARRVPKLSALSTPSVKPARKQAGPATWQQVQAALNWQTNPAAARAGQLPSADQLMPVGTSGPQTWLPISGSQLGNATTIVQQALAMRMGVRSAVIAVATAMQESQLQDLGYGDGGSLGLFQQQASMGWGTAQQIMNPAFAADAFLTALQQYQASDPGWATQPLWETAQGVQKSGFPFAYAQWEEQAASLVRQIAMSLQQ